MSFSLTVSSVDATANTLTITAHGLNTGDGFLGVFNATGTLPAPLSSTAEYWAIRVDANTIKLATSSTNAFAGTAIDLTTTGSGGTLLLLGGLPWRRPRINAPLTQIFSQDLNTIFDSIVALNNLLTAQVQIYWSSVILGVPLVLATGQTLTLTDGLSAIKHGQEDLPLSAAAFGVEAGGSASLGDGSWSFAAVSILSASIPLGPSRRIKNVVLEYNRAGAGTVTMTLKKRVAGTLTTISTQAFASGTGWTTGNFATPPNVTIASGEKLFVDVQCDNPAHVVGGAVVQFDRP